MVLRRLLIAITLFASTSSVAWAAAGSVGYKAGLNQAHDPLALSSSVALVADADTLELIYAKNPHVPLPIASLTKIMTAVVVLEAQQDLNEQLIIGVEDIDRHKFTNSRLEVGSRLSRRDLIHLALMASENRAASALSRHYPGGQPAFVAQMNRRATELGMRQTLFAEATGLSEMNRASANDLARLFLYARNFPLIAQYSTEPTLAVSGQQGELSFRNTNRLLKLKEWDIRLQKTGFINEAGRCLVMLANMSGRNLLIVLLDAGDSQGRVQDAERIRRYMLARN